MDPQSFPRSTGGGTRTLKTVRSPDFECSEGVSTERTPPIPRTSVGRPRMERMEFHGVEAQMRPTYIVVP
jgi:hypothetical protein